LAHESSGVEDLDTSKMQDLLMDHNPNQYSLVIALQATVGRMVEFVPYVAAKTKWLVASFSSVDIPFAFGSWLNIGLGLLT
jgi:hypothetical protein